MPDIKAIKNLLVKLEELEKTKRIFSTRNTPLEAYPSAIAGCVIRSIIKEINANQKDFFGSKGEICLFGYEGMEGLKNLAREFLTIFDNPVNQQPE